MTAKNNGKAWTSTNDSLLQKLAKGNTPTRIIAMEMGRTPGAIQSHASAKGVSLKPTNQSPYNRRKTS
jgi:hypothetical protein